jgi:hypothetical protein
VREQCHCRAKSRDWHGDGNPRSLGTPTREILRIDAWKPTLAAMQIVQIVLDKKLVPGIQFIASLDTQLL